MLQEHNLAHVRKEIIRRILTVKALTGLTAGPEHEGSRVFEGCFEVSLLGGYFGHHCGADLMVILLFVFEFWMKDCFQA